MFLKSLRHNRRLTQLTLALAFTGLGALAHSAAAPQIGLTNDQVTITGSGSSAGFSQTGTIAADGTVSTIVNVPSTNGVGIPSFAFTLVSTSTDTDYSADFRVGIIIQDKNVPNRRFEAEIPKISLTVAGGVMTGTIPASQSLVAKGQNGSGSLQVDVTATNNAASGPITISGGTVQMNAADLISRIRNANALFDSVILAEFDQPASYEYWIAVKETTGTSASFGKTTGGFAAFTGQPAAAPFSLLTSGNYTGGYFVKGEFNVVAASSGGGGGSSSADVTQGTASLQTELASIPAIVAGVAPSAETVAKIDTAVTNAGNVASQAAAAAAAGTLTASQAIATLLQTNNAVELAGKAKQAGATSGVSASVSVLTNIANIFDGLSTSGTALTGTQPADLAAAATKAIANAKSLIKEGSGGTTQAELIALVDAGAQLLSKMTKLNGNSIPNDVLTSVNALSETAIGNSLQGVAAASGIDRADPVAVRNFLQTNAVAKEKAVSNTPVVLLTFQMATDTFLSFAETCGTFTSALRESIHSTYPITIPLAKMVVQTSYCAPPIDTAALLSGGNILEATVAPTIEVEDSGRFTYSTSTEKYVGRSVVRIVPSSIPNGSSALANGKTLLVQAGVATEVSPTALDEATFGAAVTGAGFQLSYNDNGSIAIDLGNNESFSGAFAYNNVGTATSCGAVTFTAPTGSPTDPDYAFIANCADGAKQRITPFANTNAFYTTLSNEGLSATTDRNTGIVTIPNFGSFKPSFFVTPLSLNDTAYYNATKNADGIAFRASDANGDGKTDYEIISATGVQIIYGL